MSTGIIARNSFWYGIETGVGFISGLLTSIAIARALGPEKLGPFVYIGWLASIAASLGGLGIPAATSKYMAEYLGRNEPGIARAIFFFTLRLQTLLATALTLIALAIVALFADPSRLVFAALLVSSILPMMINFIPAQANSAAEDFAANVPGSLVSTLVYVAGVVLSLTFGWELVGLAASVLLMRVIELFVRLIPAVRRFRLLPAGTVPPPLRSKIFVFSKQNLVLLALSAIVWDRSEMLFLQYFSNVRQLAFYSVVFNITERLRVAPQIFASAVSPTILAQYGRDPAQLNSIVATAVRYLSLIVFPLNVGIAILSAPFIQFLYGTKYLEAIPLMALAALLATPKSLLGPLTALLSATENQAVVVRWTIAVAVVNVGLDLWLIPSHAAMGAVIANGVAQLVITVILFFRSASILRLRLPVLSLAKIGLCTGIMATAVSLMPIKDWSPLAAVTFGGITGALVFLLMLRITSSMEPQDRVRFHQISGRVPAPLRSWLDRTVDILIPGALPIT